MAFSGTEFKEIVIPENVSKIEQIIFNFADIKVIKVIGHKEKPPGWVDTWNKKTSLHSCNEFIDVIWDYKAD